MFGLNIGATRVISDIEQKFWSLIDQVPKDIKIAEDEEYFDYVVFLTDLFEENCNSDELLQIYKLIEDLIMDLDRSDLDDKINLAYPGLNDDAMVDFKLWLISRGEDIYRAALRDPQSIFEPTKDTINCEFATFAIIPMETWVKLGYDETIGDFEEELNKLIDEE